LDRVGASFGEAAGSSVGAGITRISGLVHDGVPAVVLVTDKRNVRAAVRGNAVLKDVHGRVVRVRWRYRGTEHMLSTALPNGY
jgi:hypothetical protein